MLAVIKAVLLLLGVSLGQECGKPVIDPNAGYQRIINGEEVVAHSYPWMTSIQSSVLSEPHYCGASIISPNWVLTAAHCAVLVYVGTYSGDEVALGQHDRLDHNEEGKQVLPFFSII